jgi:hypothetical protein
LKYLSDNPDTTGGDFFKNFLIGFLQPLGKVTKCFSDVSHRFKFCDLIELTLDPTEPICKIRFSSFQWGPKAYLHSFSPSAQTFLDRLLERWFEPFECLIMT